MGSDSGGGGVGSNALWVSKFYLFIYLFAFWLWVLFDFGLLVV